MSKTNLLCPHRAASNCSTLKVTALLLHRAARSWAMPDRMNWGVPSHRCRASSILSLRIEIVTAVIGLSVPTVYRLMAKGDFPRPIKLTSSARAWKLSDIIDWMQSRAAARGPSEERA